MNSINMLKMFGINSNKKNMAEYHDMYLISDILLLADVFENFRNTCLQCYKLDPAHYLTSRGLSWDAMLKMTDVKLELVTDIDIANSLKKAYQEAYHTNRYMEKQSMICIMIIP